VFTLEPNFKVFKLFNSTKQNSKGLGHELGQLDCWAAPQQRTKTAKNKTKQQVLDSNTSWSWRLGLLLLDSTVHNTTWRHWRAATAACALGTGGLAACCLECLLSNANFPWIQ
jgi:hypothetical protein